MNRFTGGMKKVRSGLMFWIQRLKRVEFNQTMPSSPYAAPRRLGPNPKTNRYFVYCFDNVIGLMEKKCRPFKRFHIKIEDPHLPPRIVGWTVQKVNKSPLDFSLNLSISFDEPLSKTYKIGSKISAINFDLSRTRSSFPRWLKSGKDTELQKIGIRYQKSRNPMEIIERIHNLSIPLKKLCIAHSEIRLTEHITPNCWWIFNVSSLELKDCSLSVEAVSSSYNCFIKQFQWSNTGTEFKHNSLEVSFHNECPTAKLLDPLLPNLEILTLEVTGKKPAYLFGDVISISPLKKLRIHADFIDLSKIACLQSLANLKTFYLITRDHHRSPTQSEFDSFKKTLNCERAHLDIKRSYLCCTSQPPSEPEPSRPYSGRFYLSPQPYYYEPNFQRRVLLQREESTDNQDVFQPYAFLTHDASHEGGFIVRPYRTGATNRIYLAS
ncbi:hypothetical protein TRICI_001902 [Trichomonascus ciferrii]|uniref:Uncharacterized protein n=1 Tax=Trichomonascus ciferrii TaxID=44093 RepID=A0A642V7T6_9ASCO|nr:hypothetical protein TRICI_001902 [Trichomonascus ciferrii]